MVAPSTGTTPTPTTVKTTPTKEGGGRFSAPSPQSITALAPSPIFDPSLPLTTHSHVHASNNEGGLKNGSLGGSKTGASGDTFPPPFPSLCSLPSSRSDDSISSMDVQVDHPPTSLLSSHKGPSTTKFSPSLSGLPFHHTPLLTEPLYSEWFRDPSAPLKLNEFDAQVLIFFLRPFP